MDSTGRPQVFRMKQIRVIAFLTLLLGMSIFADGLVTPGAVNAQGPPPNPGPPGFNPVPPCGPGTQGQRFVLFANGTEVCDNTTGIFWEQEPDNIVRSWLGAANFCPTLGIGYRLPEIKELISLVDYGQGQPALPADHPFSNILPILQFWSATALANDPIPLQAWAANFYSGSVFTGLTESIVLRTWCVR